MYTECKTIKFVYYFAVWFRGSWDSWGTPGCFLGQTAE